MQIGAGEDSSAKRRLVLVVEYQGTRYHGFQLQAGQPTIQGELEGALLKLTGESTRIRGASRTDSGAHAKGQVVDFLTQTKLTNETFMRGLNWHLPPDIKVRSSHESCLEFNSRKDAVSRIYRYTVVASSSSSPLLREYAHWVRAPLNVEAMAQGAKTLIGTHDFGALSGPIADGRSTVRTVKRWDVFKNGDVVIMEAEADGFLPHQIRKTASVILEIGKERLKQETMRDILHGKVVQLDRCPYLPAKGLCLMAVTYREFSPEGKET